MKFLKVIEVGSEDYDIIDYFAENAQIERASTKIYVINKVKFHMWHVYCKNELQITNYLVAESVKKPIKLLIYQLAPREFIDDAYLPYLLVHKRMPEDSFELGLKHFKEIGH